MMALRFGRRVRLIQKADDVTVDGSCTYTDSGRFFSYRRDKQGGRMALVAWLADHDAA